MDECGILCRFVPFAFDRRGASAREMRRGNGLLARFAGMAGLGRGVGHKKRAAFLITVIFSFQLSVFSCFAAAIFSAGEPIVAGLPVLEMSAVFADVFENLDKEKWGGKDIRTAIESMETIAPDVHIALTDRRIVVLHRDTIIGNWDLPPNGWWNEYGEVSTAILIKLCERLPSVAKLDVPGLYNAAIGAMMSGIGGGKYIYSKAEQDKSDPHVLTTLGIAGVRTNRGDYALNTIFKGSPADNAGLSDGDILISANGTPLRDLSDMEVLGLFNGFSSGTIKVSLLDSNGREKTATLRRATVVVADADIVVRDKILEIIVHKISDNSVDIVAAALDKYDPNGIYLDLRGTTGDDEIALAKMAGLFLGKIPVARIKTIGGNEVELIPGSDAMTGTNVVVAVSNTTSGSAEALAFAFYEAGVGILIGVPTSGMTKLPTKISLKNGGALELMNREMASGSGRTIDGRGFFPPVCLSNIRNAQQKDVFLVNVKNHDWTIQDFNADEKNDPSAVRRGCPNITSGRDEDSAALAVAMDILLTDGVYKTLTARME